MPLPRYLPHVLYALAITSVSIHLLVQRKGGAEQRLQTRAQIDVLESVTQRLRSGESVTDAEIERLRRMVAVADQGREEKNRDGQLREKNVNWKEVLLGRAIAKNSNDDVRLGK